METPCCNLQAYTNACLHCLTHIYWKHTTTHTKCATNPVTTRQHLCQAVCQHTDSRMTAFPSGSFPQQNNNTSRWNKTLTTGIPFATTAYYQVVKIAWHSPVIVIIHCCSLQHIAISVRVSECLNMGKYHWDSGWLDKSYYRVVRSSALLRSEFKWNEKWHHCTGIYCSKVTGLLLRPLLLLMRGVGVW